MCGLASLAFLSAAFPLLVDSVGQALETVQNERRRRKQTRASASGSGGVLGGPEGAVGNGGTERWFISSTGADGIWGVWLCSLSCLGPRGYYTMIHE